MKTKENKLGELSLLLDWRGCMHWVKHLTYKKYGSVVDMTVFLKCKDYGEKIGLMNKTLPVVFFFFLMWSSAQVHQILHSGLLSWDNWYGSVCWSLTYMSIYLSLIHVSLYTYHWSNFASFLPSLLWYHWRTGCSTMPTYCSRQSLWMVFPR